MFGMFFECAYLAPPIPFSPGRETRPCKCRPLFFLPWYPPSFLFELLKRRADLLRLNVGVSDNEDGCLSAKAIRPRHYCARCNRLRRDRWHLIPTDFFNASQTSPSE